jgi:putative transposase
MGRPKRLQFAGACYYVVLRGNNRQDIFMSNQDRRAFLSLLRTYKERYQLKVYAYCLMPQEAHLLIETERPNLSVVMQGFNTVYTKLFNGEHNTSGHVFQGRYKALLVDPERYLSEMTRYVHLCPARAGMKDKPWRYQWSSCAAYVESDEDEALVDSDRVLSQFGKIRLKQSVRYLQYIKDCLKSGTDILLPITRGIAVGSEAFLARLEEKKGGPAAPAGRDLRAEARRLLTEIAAKHNVAEDKLTGPLQWRELTAVRRKAIYRIWKETQLGVTDLGRLFNRTPSAVSQLIRAMETASPAAFPK